MKFSSFLKVVVFCLLIAGCGSKENKVSAQDSSMSAAVTLIEYSDYQCPACAYFHPIVDRLKEEFGGQLHVDYRFFPLNSHQFGALSARAVQAAKNQGKFKQMHDLVFQNQQRWVAGGNPQSVFVGYARQLELDVEQFKDDLNASETQRTVMEDKQRGQEMGVNSTPTFFINGNKVEQNPATFEEFKALIEGYMEKAG